MIASKFPLSKGVGLCPTPFSRLFAPSISIDPVSAAIGGVSLIGNWISSNKVAHRQQEMFNRQLAFNEIEASKNRAFQSNERQAAQGWQERQALLNYQRNEASRISQNFYNIFQIIFIYIINVYIF